MRNKNNIPKSLTVIIVILTLVLGSFFHFDVAKGEDNFSWTQRSMPSSASWYAIAYGGGKFVAVATSSSNKAAVSADGITWTASTLPVSAYWEAIAYGNGIFVAIAGNSSIAATSSDGVNWTQRTLPVSGSWTTVTYGYGSAGFVAVSSGSNRSITSSDGITWTQRTLPVSAYWKSITYGGDYYVAVATNSSTIAITSKDGIIWTQRTLPVAASWNSITYGEGIFLTVALGSNNAATSSDNGETWIQRTLPLSAVWRSVAYGNRMFVAVASNSSKSIISSDGIDWIQKDLPSTTAWYSTAYGNGMFAAITGISIAASSTGGIMPSANTSTDVNLDLDSTVSLTCTDSVTLGTITGTGQSSLTTNEALCTVSTNNSTGYALYWQASTAYLENGTGDQVEAYTPITPDTPENWSVSATESEWGAKLKSGSTTYDSDTWGSADTYAGGNWLNIATSPYQIITRTTETTQTGDNETILFGAEIGSNKFQPTGTYDTDVIITATTL